MGRSISARTALRPRGSGRRRPRTPPRRARPCLTPREGLRCEGAVADEIRAVCSPSSQASTTSRRIAPGPATASNSHLAAPRFPFSSRQSTSGLAIPGVPGPSFTERCTSKRPRQPPRTTIPTSNMHRPLLSITATRIPSPREADKDELPRRARAARRSAVLDSPAETARCYDAPRSG